MVTIPPDVVLTRASSTVFVKASNRTNLFFAGIVGEALVAQGWMWFEYADKEINAEREIDCREMKLKLAGFLDNFESPMLS